MNRTCLSFWFPLIRDAGLPVPKTAILEMDPDAMVDLHGVMYGKGTTGKSDVFLKSLTAAANEMGFPCFLRTGQGSGKHNWKDTCYLEKPEDIPDHVLRLIEWSEIVDIIGLPWNVWAVREMLPTKPVMVCVMYGMMPVCREFRLFVHDSEVLCCHPYWPKKALEQGLACPSQPDVDAAYAQLCHLPVHEHLEVRHLASSAGHAVGGAWSVDVLHTERGWFVTDMAEANRSYHWQGCKNESIFR